MLVVRIPAVGDRTAVDRRLGAALRIVGDFVSIALPSLGFATLIAARKLFAAREAEVKLTGVVRCTSLPTQSVRPSAAKGFKGTPRPGRGANALSSRRRKTDRYCRFRNRLGGPQAGLAAPSK
eukprot:4418908-Prymnesium_polylepis.1